MKINRYKTWIKQGRYRTLGFQGKKGIPMILVLTENGTVLEPVKIKRV